MAITIDKIDYIGNTHPEWPSAWEALCDLTGHYTDCNPVDGECWQYMGTYWRDRPFPGGGRVLVHSFRHRNRPNDKPIGLHPGPCGGRVYLEIGASNQHSGGRNEHLAGTLIECKVRQYAD